MLKRDPCGGGDFPVVDGVHQGERRGVRRDPVAEQSHGGGGALDLGDDAFGGVGDVSGQPEPGGAGVQVGPEAHALHDAADHDPPPLHGSGDGGPGLWGRHGRCCAAEAGAVVATSGSSGCGWACGPVCG